MPIRYCAYLLAVLATCAAAPVASAQSPTPYVFSERLGATIEPEERAYFGLFPEVEGFARATAYEAAGDSVRVVIERPAADSTLTMTRAAAQALGRFVESFEQHGTAFYNPDWQVSRPYVRADVPVPSVQGYSTMVVNVEDGYYAGHPFYVSDSLLVLSRRPSRDWRAFGGEGLVIQASEVEEVRVYGGAAGFYGNLLASRYAPLLGLPFGLFADLVIPNDGIEGSRAEQRIVAASAGAVLFSILRLSRNKWRPYDEALRDIEGEAWFTADARPLELPDDRALARRAVERPAPRPRWRSALGWFDTGIGVVLSPPATQHYTFYSNFVGEDAQQEVEISSGGAMEAALALRPLAWLSGGLGVFVAPTPEVGANDLQEVAYSRPSFRAFGEVDLVRLIRSDSPFGLAVGSGFLLAESAVSQRFPENVATTYDPEGYDLRERGFRPFYSVTAEVGVFSETALFGRLLGWGAPSIEVPLTEVQSVAFPGTIVYRVEPHTVDFGQRGFVVGLRAGF